MKSLISLLKKSGKTVQSLQPYVGDILVHWGARTQPLEHSGNTEWRVTKADKEKITVISVYGLNGSQSHITHHFPLKALNPDWKYK